MSYRVRLKSEDGGTASVESHQAGGVVASGGSNIATCSITYNYSYFYYNEIDEDDGIRWLDGKKASDTIPVLEEAIDTLGTDPHDDVDSYWIPCPGNAGRDLQTLLKWSRQHPDATWEVL